jgi:hypothetical protein
MTFPLQKTGGGQLNFEISEKVQKSSITPIRERLHRYQESGSGVLGVLTSLFNRHMIKGPANPPRPSNPKAQPQLGTYPNRVRASMGFVRSRTYPKTIGEMEAAPNPSRD